MADRQTILDAAQIRGSEAVSACTVVPIPAGAQLSKKFVQGGTSSTKVMQQQMKSESEELTERVQETYDIHEQTTSS